MRTASPFRITKSTDLSDQEILELWVKYTQQSDGAELYDPRSPMPMIVLGAKGSGKTHLIRYHSLGVRRLAFEQAGTTMVDGLATDRYIGIYIRCNGLNSERFTGKGIPTDVWEAAFSYYVELWFAQEALATLTSIDG